MDGIRALKDLKAKQNWSGQVIAELVCFYLHAPHEIAKKRSLEVISDLLKLAETNVFGEPTLPFFKMVSSMAANPESVEIIGKLKDAGLLSVRFLRKMLSSRGPKDETIIAGNPDANIRALMNMAGDTLNYIEKQ